MDKNRTPEKQTWIFWRWKKGDQKTFSKSYVQDVIITTAGKLIELSDHTFYTQYPTRVLLNEIQIL